jgi:hypothetical protein
MLPVCGTAIICGTCHTEPQQLQCGFAPDMLPTATRTGISYHLAVFFDFARFTGPKTIEKIAKVSG